LIGRLVLGLFAPGGRPLVAGGRLGVLLGLLLDGVELGGLVVSTGGESHRQAGDRDGGEGTADGRLHGVSFISGSFTSESGEPARWLRRVDVTCVTRRR